MTIATEIFTTGTSQLIRIVYVQGTGIRAERGILEQDVFVQTHIADEILFSERPDLTALYDVPANKWNEQSVSAFLFDKPATEATRELPHVTTEEEFNEWMNSL